VIADQSPVALVVGPEGGFERREIESLAMLGTTAVSLGRRKLRTETAAIVALVLILHLDGQLG
jgi:16S rRNA (uracil1498-N3)-methyltransferase